MPSAPIVLVPGFWLGAWAWDEVAGALRDDGHEVTALTLPGLESADADRAAVTLEDHVDAICAAVEAAGRPVVLVVHSGAGGAGYAASDRMPDRIAAMVYVDSGPLTGAIAPDVEGDELPLPPPEHLDQYGSLEGLSDEQLETFRRRAVPEPAAIAREAPRLSDPARLGVPTTVICTSLPSAQLRAAVADGEPWTGGLAQLRELEYVDLPTGHWPMWSRPGDLARILGQVAAEHAA